MCEDPLCRLTHSQLRRENDRLRARVSRLAAMLDREGVDVVPIFREVPDA